MLTELKDTMGNPEAGLQNDLCAAGGQHLDAPRRGPDKVIDLLQHFCSLDLKGIFLIKINPLNLSQGWALQVEKSYKSAHCVLHPQTEAVLQGVM